MADQAPLSDEERAELEELRAEKAKREEAQRAAQERAELERLKAEKAQSEAEAEEDRRIAEARERGRKLMEPDEDDLKMPLGQKMVILFVVVVAVVWFAAMTLG